MDACMRGKNTLFKNQISEKRKVIIDYSHKMQTDRVIFCNAQ